MAARFETQFAIGWMAKSRFTAHLLITGSSLAGIIIMKSNIVMFAIQESAEASLIRPQQQQQSTLLVQHDIDKQPDESGGNVKMQNKQIQG